MHRLKSFLLLYKAFLFFGFLVEFVSSCNPDNRDKNPISIGLTSSSGWRINMSQRLALPNTDIIGFNSGYQPDYNEIFLLSQPISGVYEFRAYEQFYETAVIEVPIDALYVGAGFKINNSTNGDNQRFYIDCNSCNLQTNSEDFAPYHTSCLITNVKSGLCINGIDSNVKISQADCATASRWDLYGRKIPDGLTITSNSQESTTAPAQGCPESNFDNSTSLKPFTIHVSMVELVGIVFGSMMSTTIIVIMIGYCCWRRKQYKVNNQNVQYKDNDQYERNDQYEENDRGNVQIYDDIK